MAQSVAPGKGGGTLPVVVAPLLSLRTAPKELLVRWSAFERSQDAAGGLSALTRRARSRGLRAAGGAGTTAIRPASLMVEASSVLQDWANGPVRRRPDQSSCEGTTLHCGRGALGP